MKLVLHVRRRGEPLRKAWIGPGQSLTVGGGDLVDLTLPGGQLKPRHFEIRCEFAGANLRLLDDDADLLLNGGRFQPNPSAEAGPLSDGDEIAVGEFAFRVERIGVPDRPASRAPVPATQGRGRSRPSRPRSVEPPTAPIALPRSSVQTPSDGTVLRESSSFELIEWAPETSTTQLVDAIKPLIGQNGRRLGRLIGPASDPASEDGRASSAGPDIGDLAAVYVGTHLSDSDRRRLSPRMVWCQPESWASLGDTTDKPSSLWLTDAGDAQVQQALVLAGQGRAGERECPRPEWMLDSASLGRVDRVLTAAPDTYLRAIVETFACVGWQRPDGKGIRVLRRRTGWQDSHARSQSDHRPDAAKDS